jgi:peptide/nickel transport system permease protein
MNGTIAESPARAAATRDDPADDLDRLNAYKARASRTWDLVRQALRSPTTTAGVVIILLIVLMAVFAPLLVEPNSPDAYQMPRDWENLNAPPGTPGHPLGTAADGGDVLYGIVWGARSSIRLALTVVSLAVLIGVFVGSTAAALGGRWDEYLMRGVDLFQSIPNLIFALAIAGTLGPSFRNIIIALVVTMWAPFARMIRGEVLLVKQLEYVDAARVLGDKRWRIYLKDILPNSLTPIIVMGTMALGNAVLIGATLSFIGLAEVGLAEWGNLVSAGQQGLLAGYWWVATFGGVMVFLWALACNLVGDGLRDLFDPRSESR